MEPRIIKHGNHVINNDYDGYMFNHNVSEGYDFNSHIHKCHEFIKVLSGRLLYNVEGTDYILSEGDVIMTKPEELHSFSFPEPCRYERIFFHIYPGMFHNHPQLDDLLCSRLSGYFNRIPAALAERYGIDDIFKGLERCCAAPVPETDFLALTYALQLATVVGIILRDEHPDNPPVTLNKTTNSVRDYIDKHYNEPISLNDIASAVYMSPSYASRTFKRETGMKIKEYLNMRRVTQAKNLIMEGRKATAIFSGCGFKDYSTFFRAFIKYSGMTPDEFRRSVTRSSKIKETRSDMPS